MIHFWMEVCKSMNRIYSGMGTLKLSKKYKISRKDQDLSTLK